MDDRRPIFAIHLPSMILLFLLAATLACAQTLDTEQTAMTPFASQSSHLKSALNLSQFEPSARLGRAVEFDQASFTALVGQDVSIINFKRYQDGPDLAVSLVSEKGDDLAIRLDISQIAGRDRMAEALAGSFDLISAPLDWIESLSRLGADRVVRLSAKDTYAVATRGDILVQVSVGEGFAASSIAVKVLNDIFK